MQGTKRVAVHPSNRKVLCTLHPGLVSFPHVCYSGPPFLESTMLLEGKVFSIFNKMSLPWQNKKFTSAHQFSPALSSLFGNFTEQ